MSVLPRDWSMTKVKYLASYMNGYPFAPTDWEDGGKPIVRIQNLTDPEASWNTTTLDVPQCYTVEAGDILISWSASLGVYVWEREPALLNQHIFKAIPTKEVERRYFVWAAKWFVGELQSQAHGSTMQHLTKDVFGGFAVPLPPKAEQTRIANFLDEQTARIDALIAEKERLSALLSISLESFIESAVLPKAGVCLIPLKRVSERIITGPFGSALHSSDYIEQGVPVINPSHITGGTLCPDANVSVSAETAEAMSAYRMTPGDVIVGRRGEMGRCAVVPQEGNGWLCGTGCLLVSPNPVKVMASYLQLVISSRASKEWLSLESVGSTMENLNGEIIGRLPGYFPHPREQRERVVTVGRAMTQHEALIRHVSEHIACLREYRSSLISAAVTGQLDIENFRREVVQT